MPYQVFQLFQLNPICHGGGSGSVYQKLASLCSEIEQGIKNISEPNPSLQSEILRIRSNAFKESHPEVEYAIQLYRKYADETSAALQLSHRNRSPHEASGGDQFDEIRMTDDIPLFLYQGVKGQIVGEAALNRNIFWFRLVTGFFCMLSFSVISSVDHIHDRQVSAESLLKNYCWPIDQVSSGQFSFIPFQYMIAVMSFLFVHSVLFTGYYLLPVDSSDKKYIPGLEWILSSCLNSNDVSSASTRSSEFMKAHSKFIEFCVDGGLLAMAIITNIIAAAAIEAPTPFSDENSFYTYYSISTFYATFDSTNPSCLTDSFLPKLRAGIAMSFLATIALGLAFQVSCRSYLMERQLNASNNHQQVDSSDKSGPIPV